MIGSMKKQIGIGAAIVLVLGLGWSAFFWPQAELKAVPEQSQAASSAPAKKAQTKTPASLDGAMVPHKALYEITMVSAASGSQVVNISGNMFFEWKPTCDAWTTDHRFNLTYEYADSPAMQITSDFSTWESRDGKSFDFSSRRSRDGELYEELRGHVDRLEDGSGKAVYSLPENLSFDLPKGFVLPMQHTLDILSVIDKSNSPFVNRVLFDGSDTEGPIEVNAFIGKSVNAMARLPVNAELDVSLLNAPARDIRMAFFPLLDQETESSDYEMNAVFHDNGVISDMMIDYHEFSIHQKLIALEKTKIDLNCDAN
ncbi:MAG: DUF1849 family protein [Rhodospirillales bacterium]|nr:DUF1849 family protein [Rhodospirillales bacterium]